VDVLVPAHDEQATLPSLLQSLESAGRPASLGTVLVVADHCGDATAEVARAHGAVVVERGDGPRGKPAALRDGLAALATRPDRGDAVLILDADCVVSESYVERMAEALARGHRVAQSAYEVRGSDREPVRGSRAGVRWGFLLKSVVRPTGLARLGLPCQLSGTGMVFRRDVLDLVAPSDDLVEDVRMSHDLLLAGVQPRFVPDALLVSPLPADEGGLTRQRLRWEGGQLGTWRRLPSLFARLLMRGELRSALALADWSAPPLTLAVAGFGAATAATTGLAVVGLVPPAALVWPAAAGGLLAAYLTVGLWAAGGPRAVGEVLGAAPAFLAWKAGVYRHLAREGPPASWDRTPREAAGGDR
jgi:cellulose synthase/poly-beta-1,6-N-acetylglucosamine synthase-like glycosyltransferase